MIDIEDCAEAVLALGDMLTRVLASGEEHKNIASGVQVLFDQQYHALDGVRASLGGLRGQIRLAADKLAALMEAEHGGSWFAEVDHEDPFILIGRETPPQRESEFERQNKIHAGRQNSLAEKREQQQQRLAEKKAAGGDV